MKLVYKNSSKIKGSYVLNINTKFLSKQDLKLKLDSNLNDKKLLEKLVEKYGEKLFLASGNENRNKFFVWLSKIKEWDNQKNVNVKLNIRPSKSNKDKENDNVIDFFNFSDNLNKEFQLKIDFNFNANETILDVKSNTIKPYNKKSSLYKHYTKSERFLEQTKEIKTLAKNIVGDEKDNFKQANKIFNWILDNITYKYPPEKRGVIATLKKKCGDCGEFNFLFIVFCRCLGIPARSVLGMWAIPKLKQGFHAWAEFYLENVGWIPVDASVAQGLKVKKDEKFIKFMKDIKNPSNPNYYFGNLDNKRIIFSKGNNILLQDCPKRLAKFEMMEECRSLYMQPTSVYPFVGGNKNGIFIIDVNPKLDITAQTSNHS